MDVRSTVKSIQREVRDSDGMLPARATALLCQLTGLVGNVNDEIRDADQAYKLELLQALHDKTDPLLRLQTKLRVETESAYRRVREAKDLKELMRELIASLKYVVNSSLRAR